MPNINQVKICFGNNNKKFTLDIGNDEILKKMLISELKALCKQQHDLDVDDLRLMFEAKQLEDDKSLKYYNISDKSFIHVIVKLLGGSL